jgi:hypothetical protein
MPSPAQFLREATRAVPAVKYAVGIGGVIAVLAIVRSFSISPTLAVLGAIVMLFLMGVLVVFARMSALGKTHMLLPALVFAWFVLILFMLTSLALFGSVFLGSPRIRIPSLHPVAEPIPGATSIHPIVETRAIGSGEGCPAGLEFAGILHADSRPGDANDRKVDQSLLLPAGVQLDTSYQQATNRDLAGGGAESNLSPAYIPGGIFIAGRGSSERGNRWAILTPYDKTIPILARSADSTKIGNTRYRVTLGLYVDTGHPGNGFRSVDALVCFKSLSAKPATRS